MHRALSLPLKLGLIQKKSWATPTPTPNPNVTVHNGYPKTPEIIQYIGTLNCSYQNLAMPLGNSSLPKPASGQDLLHITIGRGTLNYTCATSDSSSVPVEIGAIATLYDTFCVATRYPDIQRLLPDLALQLSLPTNVTGTPTNTSAILDYTNNGVIIGHLYNENVTYPVFPIDTHQNGYFGRVLGNIAQTTDAPTWAPAGQGVGGYGAAPWQYIESINGTVGDVESVYRINTAGGKAPATCEGRQPLFGIEYAAEYWFWGTAGKSG